MAVRISVFGAAGRMGRRVAALAADHDCCVVAALEAAAHPQLGRPLVELVPGMDASRSVVLTDDVGAAVDGAQVVIDFALVDGLEARVQAAITGRAGLISGVTGLTVAQQALMDTAAERIPVLWAPNMSQGVNVLLDLVERACSALPGFDVEVHETHHRHKADAPSGTAIALAQRAAASRGDSAGENLLLCRGRDPGARPEHEVGVVASRGGDTVGEHTVYLFGAGERIELVHRAQNRDIFVHGALRAARFLVGKPAGRYTLAQVLEAG